VKVQNPDGEWKNYPPSFSDEDKSMLQSFVEEHADVCCMRELTPLTPHDTICIRHDVDYSLEHAIKFARWENDRGIHSTYFVLHTAWYYRDRIKLYGQMSLLQNYGHEVGIHLDSVNESAIDNHPHYDAAAILLKAKLAELRSAGFDIVGSAAHGGIYTDLELFENRFTLDDFGLQYEAYDLQHKLNVNYISDNRGKWRAPLVKVPGKITVMSIHPEHWPFK